MRREVSTVTLILLLCGGAALGAAEPMIVSCWYAGSWVDVECVFEGQARSQPCVDVMLEEAVTVDGTKPFYVEHGWTGPSWREAPCLARLNPSELAVYCCDTMRFELRVDGEPVFPHRIAVYYGAIPGLEGIADPAWNFRWGFVFDAGMLPAGTHEFTGTWERAADLRSECWTDPSGVPEEHEARSTTVTVVYP
jgi:hypothetical protein